MKKRILALWMVLCLLLGVVPVVSATAVIASGTCGENLTWVLTEDGALTISGKGKMSDYSTKWEMPWRNERGSIISLAIADGVTAIGNYAFTDCYNLQKVSLPNSLDSIGYYAFDCCYDLSDIVLPNSLTTMKSGAFRDCDSLVSITIPNKVTMINDETFMDCANLVKVNLPNSITHIGYYAFALSQLTEINIPNSATHVDRTAFVWTPWSEKLTGYVIVGDHILLGYYGQTPLTGTATIPDGVKYIAPNAFSGRYTITNVEFPHTLIEIGHWAFESTEIGTLTIPSSVSYIADGAFLDCSKLKTVYFEGDAPIMEADIFNNDTLTAYYPQNNPTWTTDVLLDYEGITTWVGYNPFADVSSDSFYYTPVVWASTNGITSGATATTFNPNGDCLRAQVVTFLWRAAGEPEPTSERNPFVDVKPSDFYYKAVLWAVENNITNGADATHFNPMGICNRAQVVTFLYRAFRSPAVENTDNPFTDVPEGSFYRLPVLWAVENGITNGLSATQFGPNANCNRAQIVTFLYRAYN